MTGSQDDIVKQLERLVPDSYWYPDLCNFSTIDCGAVITADRKKAKIYHIQVTVAETHSLKLGFLKRVDDAVRSGLSQVDGSYYLALVPSKETADVFVVKPSGNGFDGHVLVGYLESPNV